MAINGNAGNNTLNGTTGDDVISGFAGDDRLFGDRGDDVLDGGPAMMSMCLARATGRRAAFPT
ncbi:MAG: hypothetical protein AAF638_03720 [Pseudomonadota bacterium]